MTSAGLQDLWRRIAEYCPRPPEKSILQERRAWDAVFKSIPDSDAPAIAQHFAGATRGRSWPRPGDVRKAWEERGEGKPDETAVVRVGCPTCAAHGNAGWLPCVQAQARKLVECVAPCRCRDPNGAPRFWDAWQREAHLLEAELGRLEAAAVQRHELVVVKDLRKRFTLALTVSRLVAGAQRAA